MTADVLFLNFVMPLIISYHFMGIKASSVASYVPIITTPAEPLPMLWKYIIILLIGYFMGRFLRKQQIIASTKVGLKIMYRVKYPEVLTILEEVQKILAQHFQEGEALMRHLVDH